MNIPEWARHMKQLCDQRPTVEIIDQQLACPVTVVATNEGGVEIHYIETTHLPRSVAVPIARAILKLYDEADTAGTTGQEA